MKMYEKSPDMPPFAMALPYVDAFWSWGIFALLLLFVAGGFAWKRAKQKIEGQVSKRIRQQIAHDFHDELGSNLSIISMYAELTGQQLQRDPETARAYLYKISLHAGRLYETVKDMLWALNPELDNGQELLLRLKDFGEELFADSGIQFSVKFSENLQQVKLPVDQKRHLLLLFKEAMHNAMKHSAAKLVLLEARLEATQVIFSLNDDGKGFNQDIIHEGEGVKSMKNRAEKMQSNLLLQASQEGTHIAVSVTF